MKPLREYLILLILLVPPLIFFTDLTRNPYYFQIVLLNALTVVLWMLWLVQSLREGKAVFVRTPADLPLWVFFGVATLSWAAMLFPHLRDPYLGYGIFSEGFKRWLFLAVNAVLVYYAAASFVHDGNRSRVTAVLLWTGWIAAAYGILQYFGIELIWPRVLNPFGGRSVSTFGNPNFLSSYLIMLFPLGFAGFLAAGSGGRRAAYAVWCFTGAGALLCTLTRSSWLGAAAGMLVFLALLAAGERSLLKKNLKAIGAVFFVLLALGIFWPGSRVSGYNPTVLQRVAETGQAGKTLYAPWHQRRLIWSCAWRMVAERPVLGTGWGCFELMYPSYQGRHLMLAAYRGFRTHANNTHNEILEVWSQTGTLGLGVYLWFLVLWFRYGFSLVRGLPGHKRLHAMAYCAAAAGMLTDNLLNVSLHFPIPGFLFWWILGMLMTLDPPREKTVSFTPVRKAAAGILLASAVLLLVRYGRSLCGEIHYFNGFKAAKLGDPGTAVTELEKSWRCRRLEVNNSYELANSYARLGERDKAVFYYEEALRANAGYDEIHFNLATMFAQQGKLDQSVDSYSRALFLDPVSLESYTALGTVFLRDPALYARAGITLFRQALTLFPDNRDLWNNLGFLQTKTGDNASALESFRRALAIDPSFEIARRNYAATAARLGKKTP